MTARRPGAAAYAAAALVLAACGGLDGARSPAPVVQGPAAAAPGIPSGEAEEREAQAAAPPPAPLRETALEPVRHAGSVSVGLLLPLTGSHAGAGGAMMYAAELALFEAGGRRAVLVPRDTAGEPLRAAEAFRELQTEGVEIVVGPLFAPSAAAVAPAARAAGIPLLALTNDVSLAGGGVWALGRHPGDEVRRILAHARGEGRTRFGLLAPRTPYGEEVREAFRGALPPAAVSGSFLYPPGDDPAAAAEAFLSAVPALNAAPGAAILVAARGRSLRALAAELAYRGVDRDRATLLGLAGWHDQKILGEPALVGGRFAAPARDASAAFAARYERFYGRLPPPSAVLAYDAVALALALSRAGGERRTALLAAPDGFLGNLGLFRLLADGSVERGLAVYRVERHGFGPVDPAPKRFGAAARR